ncbi:MAG: NADPH-dependent 7-cyano-7-deazaguanine reductase QueF [Prolixibacteraceae bacterium]|nr:NADPH-dependent 7-cyano-7-deazaguanine reductase QueF [Prolixibacteraceae bacterium]
MSIEATHLGRQSSYPQHYDPSVLVAVPRILNRQQYGISNKHLPFHGFDVWHAYEFSFLTLHGMPVAGMLKIVYPCNNEFLVESKSLKLYLNSFNMSPYGKTLAQGIEDVLKIITTDLSKLLQCTVNVNFFNHKAQPADSDFDNFSMLEELIDMDKLSCNTYIENPELLKNSSNSNPIKWGSHLLRSNCKITHQPDWGSMFLHMEGASLPTPESFLQYLVSLRNENHFHEEICELVFKRLMDKFSPEKLMVACLYTRRGGIDINPVRILHGTTLPASLVNPAIPTRVTFRQ